MAAPELKTALPSVSAPLVDRYRNVTPVWYPWLQRIVKFIDGLASGELIVDGAITTRTLAAGAVTADVIAAGAITADVADIESFSSAILVSGFITADSGFLAEAAVGTLQIAGNSVTQAVSVSVPTQSAQSSTSYTTIASTVITVSGTQPIIVWGSMLLGGARIGTLGTHDFIYDGNYWINNLVNSYVSARILISSGGTGGIQEEITVFAGEAVNVPFSAQFAGLPPGAATVSLQIKKESGFLDFAFRDVFLTALETKR